ncbi:MAG: type II toxin-antitoxin system HicA family toxin [Defluviitaleaceae bacterium]|nr:type II toxin-antitoxin system HicA family toxin [Defluviitaleaceae bacterium]
MNTKVYNNVISGKSDNNIRFVDLCNLVVDLGFELKRQRGSHRYYGHNTIAEIINIQDDKSKAKGYQVAQVRKIIKKHNL